MIPRGSIRPSALAGTWYPADPQVLANAVASLVAPAKPVPLGSLDAIIVPHAGHPYSGPTAGLGWGALNRTPRAVPIQRVILLGPAHRVGFRGIALGDYQAFAHPLGEVPVDRVALADLEHNALGAFVPTAHDLEHCLEIQLPFLHTVLPQRPIVPLLIGQGPESELNAAVDAALDRLLSPGDLLAVSSDLSHFLPYDTASRFDRETLAGILALDDRLDGERACGYKGIQAAIRRARRQGQRAVLIDYRSSGDTAGDKRSVVGYGALALGPAPT